MSVISITGRLPDSFALRCIQSLSHDALCRAVNGGLQLSCIMTECWCVAYHLLLVIFIGWVIRLVKKDFPFVGLLLSCLCFSRNILHWQVCSLRSIVELSDHSHYPAFLNLPYLIKAKVQTAYEPSQTVSCENALPYISVCRSVMYWWYCFLLVSPDVIPDLFGTILQSVMERNSQFDPDNIVHQSERGDLEAIQRLIAFQPEQVTTWTAVTSYINSLFCCLLTLVWVAFGIADFVQIYDHSMLSTHGWTRFSYLYWDFQVYFLLHKIMYNMTGMFCV